MFAGIGGAVLVDPVGPRRELGAACLSAPERLDTAEEEGAVGGKLTIFSLFESIGVFLLVFFGSLIIGLIIGIATSLLLKFTHIRRFPKIEACVVILIAYASYFFSNAIHMSGKQ